MPPDTHIGTSGWYYDHWRGNFYPAKLKKSEWLNFYITHFATVELNNSFYHLPKPTALEHWYDVTPQQFVFSMKASRYITHMTKLANPESTLAIFLERAEILREKLGPILFQLPPRWGFRKDRLEDLLNALPKNLRYVFEFRDKTWFNQECFDLLRSFNCALCFYELAGKGAPLEETADFIYIRLHGPGGPYQGSYSESELREWADRIISWKRSGKSVYCYFDNDQEAYAALNAGVLRGMVADFTP